MPRRRYGRILDAEGSLDYLLEQVMDSPFTRLPLYKGDSDNIVGVLHVKALLKAIRAHGGSAPHDLKIVEIANDPWFIPDTSTLLDQLDRKSTRLNSSH